jgi:hypothetical protein
VSGTWMSFPGVSVSGWREVGGRGCRVPFAQAEGHGFEHREPKNAA